MAEAKPPRTKVATNQQSTYHYQWCAMKPSRFLYAVALILCLASCKKSVPASEDAAPTPSAYLDTSADAGIYRGVPVFESRDAFEKQMRLSSDSPGSDEYLRSLLSLKREPIGTKVSVVGTNSYAYKGTSVAYDEVEVLDGADKGKHLFVMATVVHPGEPPPGLALLADAGDAGASAPKSPADLHREEMEKAATEGRYTDVCSGTPTFPASICTWVAARRRSVGEGHHDGSRQVRSLLGAEGPGCRSVGTPIPRTARDDDRSAPRHLGRPLGRRRLRGACSLDATDGRGAGSVRPWES